MKERYILILASPPVRDIENFPEHYLQVPHLGEGKTLYLHLFSKTKQFQNQLSSLPP